MHPDGNLDIWFLCAQAIAQRRREQLSEAIRTTIEDAGEEIDKIRETPVAAFKVVILLCDRF